MKKRHVLFLLSSFNIGGAEIDVLNLTQNLVRRNYRVTIVSSGGELEKKLPLEVNFLHLNILSSNWLSIIWVNLRIFFYCLFHAVNILNPQSVKGCLCATLASTLLRITHVVTIHNLQSAANLQTAIKLLNLIPDVTLFVSEYERNKFLKAGLHARNSNRMYSGIDINRFHPQETCPKTFSTLGIIGRLSSEKGVQYAIHAFDKIHLQYPELKLQIIGDGPERHPLECLVKALKLEKRISFLGARQDIPQLLRNIDLLLLPSLTESLSVVVREAMTAGKTVIASNVGGMPELIKHQSNGLLVKAGDIQNLANSISLCLQSPQWCHQMGKRAHKTIAQNFSMEKWVERMDQLFQRAMGTPVEPPPGAKRKIIYMTSRFPYPTHKGDKLRAFHQIQELSKYHDIYLVTLLESKKDYQYFDQLLPYCCEIFAFELPEKSSKFLRFLAHFSWIPSQIGYFHHPLLNRILPKIILAKNIDTLYCQLIRTGQYGKSLKNVYKIIDFVDAISLNLKRNLKNTVFYKRPCAWIRMLKVIWYERRMLHDFDQAVIISKVDQAFLQARSRVSNPILVIPNGVTQDFPQTSLTVRAPKWEKSLVFSGNMDYGPNADAACFLVEKILPHLNPDITVYLLGINHNARVKQLASDRVVVTGAVTSMIESLRRATVSICPMRLGAGQQNKVLEAMAAGVPVVATNVANAGVGASQCIIIEDEALRMAAAVNRLIDNPLKQQQLRKQAFHFIQEHFDWKKIMLRAESQLWNSGFIKIAIPQKKPIFITKKSVSASIFLNSGSGEFSSPPKQHPWS
ncbi:MAG: hypothetical protein COB67_10255 [SAR324 cluster bacterium]|uniref:Glycosyl transferase family 1 domain-containing protein n=1 Tax=SAR324 cluster bacterium TaxID=2024889 RepID=A0A2A4SXW3_9DELT|nr:MAG: hypothetical protein COB67_10255 [SAR324 cluster bacterium]